MSPLIAKHQIEIEQLCRKYYVRRLELFGSAADGSFDPTTSDFDFLVDYLPEGTVRAAETYFGLLFGLEDLFQRKIDLVMDRAIRNPYFRAGVDQSRTVLYAA